MAPSMERIVFLDQGTLPVPLRPPAFAHHWTSYDHTSPAEVVSRLKEATMVVTNKVKIREADLAALPGLKLIVVAATGYDCIDVDACRKRRVALANVPAYTGDSVPEHVFLFMLALRRELLGYAQLVREGAWQRSTHFVLQDFPVANLSGSTLGLLGYGRLAKGVEARAKSFGMHVLISERKGASSVRAGRKAFEDVLRESDVVSIHCPLTPETRGLLGAPELALMKKNALLINTARGGLVDEAALADALRHGRLGGAGIDVLAEEPPKNGSPLLDAAIPHLIVTPHIGWSSRQALHVLSEEIIANMEAYAVGQERNRIV